MHACTHTHTRVRARTHTVLKNVQHTYTYPQGHTTHWATLTNSVLLIYRFDGVGGGRSVSGGFSRFRRGEGGEGVEYQPIRSTGWCVVALMVPAAEGEYQKKGNHHSIITSTYLVNSVLPCTRNCRVVCLVRVRLCVCMCVCVNKKMRETR